MEAAQVCDKLVDLQQKVPVHTPAATITKVKAKTLSKKNEIAKHWLLWMRRHSARRIANRNICRPVGALQTDALLKKQADTLPRVESNKV